MYGSLYVAPTLHLFMRLTHHMWPVISLRTGIYKAVLDQLTYGPFATTSFYFLMTLMESKTFDEACTEVKNKFLPTYKVNTQKNQKQFILTNIFVLLYHFAGGFVCLAYFTDNKLLICT